MKIGFKTRAFAAVAMATALGAVAMAGPAGAQQADLGGVTTNVNDLRDGSITLALNGCTVVAAGELVTPRSNVTEGQDEGEFTATCENGTIGSWGFTATATIQSYHLGTYVNANTPKATHSLASAAGVATTAGTATGLYGGGSSYLGELHRLKVCLVSDAGKNLGCGYSLNTWVVPDASV